jgi:hypothetical protein
MNKRQVIASLNKIANELDTNGLYSEATSLTKIMKKLALDRFRGNENFDEMFGDMDDEDNESDEIEIKKLAYFMATLEADGISASTVKRYYDAGFKTITDILGHVKNQLPSDITFLQRKISINSFCE